MAARPPLDAVAAAELQRTMQLNFSSPSPLEYFGALVQCDDQFPLLEAAVSIAQDEYPDMDVQQVLGEVDQLLARLRRRFPADAALCTGCARSTSSSFGT